MYDKYQEDLNEIMSEVKSTLAVKINKLVENTFIKIVVCQNCGRLFLKHRNAEVYCNKIAPGYTDKTCKDVGYNNKVKNNPELKAYTNAYRAKHGRDKRHRRKEGLL